MQLGQHAGSCPWTDPMWELAYGPTVYPSSLSATGLDNAHKAGILPWVVAGVLSSCILLHFYHMLMRSVLT